MQNDVLSDVQKLDSVLRRAVRCGEQCKTQNKGRIVTSEFMVRTDCVVAFAAFIVVTC